MGSLGGIGRDEGYAIEGLGMTRVSLGRETRAVNVGARVNTIHGAGAV